MGEILDFEVISKINRWKNVAVIMILNLTSTSSIKLIKEKILANLIPGTSGWPHPYDPITTPYKTDFPSSTRETNNWWNHNSI